VGARNSRTNLIIHHGVTDIFDQAAKFSHILGAVEEPRDFASLCQRDEILEDIIQFPKNWTSDWVFALERGELPF